AQFLLVHLQGVVVVAAQLLDPGGIDVEADRRVAAAEGGSERQADVAQPDDGDADVVAVGEGCGHPGSGSGWRAKSSGPAPAIRPRIPRSLRVTLHNAGCGRDRPARAAATAASRHGDNGRSEEHTSELQSREKLVCRLLL